MAESRMMKRKKRRKRKRKYIFSFVILFFLSLLLYGGYEFMAGQEEARDRLNEMNTDDSNNQGNQYTDFNPAEQLTDKINVLLLGVDSRGEEKSRTDTIMIGQYDPEKDTAKLASIMRDTYVNIPGYGYNKINAAFFFGGPELLRQTLKENFDLDIHYYAIVDFQGFIHVVDTIAPDGVEIDVEKRMVYRDDSDGTYIDLYPGKQTLDGENLLDYARFRNDAEGDFGRVRRQQQIINTLKDEVLSVGGILKLPRVIGTILPYVETNMKTSTILSLGKDYLLNPIDSIETMTIPVEGSFWDETYDHAGAVLAIDEEKNRQAIKEFFETDN